MSMDEHEKIIFDVHGFATAVERDKDAIAALMKRLEEEIEAIPSKDAYILAKILDLDFVMNHDFRMMFLRACDYDPSMTAMMIVKHFEKKRKLFGEQTLGREIFQSVRFGCCTRFDNLRGQPSHMLSLSLLFLRRI